MARFCDLSGRDLSRNPVPSESIYASNNYSLTIMCHFVNLFAMCSKRTLFRVAFIRRRLAGSSLVCVSPARIARPAAGRCISRGRREGETLVPECIRARAPVVSGTVQFRYADVSRRGLPTPIKHDSLTGRGEQSVVRDRCLVGGRSQGESPSYNSPSRRRNRN